MNKRSKFRSFHGCWIHLASSVILSSPWHQQQKQEILSSLIGCFWLKCSLGVVGTFLLKAALINIFILTANQKTVCNVKGVTHSDAPTEHYHLTLLFPSALRSILVSFSSLLLVLRPTTLLFRFSLTALTNSNHNRYLLLLWETHYAILL